MKKRISILLLLLFAIVLVACKNNENGNGNGNGDGEPPIIEKWEEYARKASNHLENINAHLRNPLTNQLLHRSDVPIGVANLWDFSAYFTAVIKTYKINRTPAIKKLFDEALEELEWYRSTNRNDDHLVYASQNGNEEPAFYDDNVWLVIGLLEAYEYTNDVSLLEKAELIQKWIYEGWQDEVGGGLLWREFPESNPPNEKERNTCINAPAAYAAARFYELTGSESHLTWAKKIYNWTKETLLDPVYGVYMDNIKNSGEINRTHWSYNSGVMISAAALLFEITEEAVYEEDAISLIENTRNVFGSTHISPAVEGEFFQDNAWFRVYLFQGFLDAVRYLDNNETAIDVMENVIKGFDFADKNHRDKFDFIVDNWNGRGIENVHDENYFVASLRTSGNLESITIFAEYLLEKGE